MKAAASVAALAALLFAVPAAVGADATALGIGYICGAEQTGSGRLTPTPAVMLAVRVEKALPRPTTRRLAHGLRPAESAPYPP